MSTLQNKIDFVALISVCIKRKIRNRMQDQGYSIFVQSEDRCDDGFGSLSERASTTLKGIKNREEYTKKACETWLDVRTFGQVFAFKGKDSVSAGVRGPVSIHQAVSISPVDVQTLQITKSVNGEPAFCTVRPLSAQRLHQCAVGRKNRLHRRGRTSGEGVSTDAVCQ